MILEIFDVEHGACALVTTGNGKRILIDCGDNATTGWEPGSALRRRGIAAIERLVVTNYDEDHVSGIETSSITSLSEAFSATGGSMPPPSAILKAKMVWAQASKRSLIPSTTTLRVRINRTTILATLQYTLLATHTGRPFRFR